jgi:uncharacterized protein YjiS (DUF1127 family)
MKTYSPSPAASHITLASLFQEILHKLSAAAAERRVRRQKKATLQEIERMDARLLDDIGVAQPNKPAGLVVLARMNPVCLAAMAFSLPPERRH